MNKHAQELINSISEEQARVGKVDAEFEAKSLFRLLNYCPESDKLLPKKSVERK